MLVAVRTAVVYLCQEQGGPAIFGQASPTFKNRFMYMAGYDEEDEFDGLGCDSGPAQPDNPVRGSRESHLRITPMWWPVNE